MRPEMTAASDIDRLSYHREIDVKRGALLRGAFNANLAGVLLNNSISDRESKSSAAFLPFRDGALGGEEGVVNAMNMLLRDSRSTIRYGDADPLPIRSRDFERATIRHGIFGVQEEIQEDLLQSSGIALDGGQVRSQFILYANPASFELVLEQTQGVEDDPVDIDFGEFGAAGAREVEQ